MLEMSFYDGIFILTSAFAAYIIYLFMMCFFEERKTGNMTVDSVINYKLNEVQGIDHTVSLRIPSNLNVSSFDLVCILGNLIDNGIRGALESSDKRLSLNMRFDRGRLFIKLENSYLGVIQQENGKIISTKEDRRNHGIGLKSVKRAVEKYDGEMDVKADEGIFSVMIVLNL